MIVLGVETSCDETSAAIIDNDRVLSNVISSQEVHAQFGGVVPELASRAHIRAIVPIVQKALRESEVQPEQIEGLAVTFGPGLVGALLVGLNFVKGLAMAIKKPFIGVNHIEGHIYGNLLTQNEVCFPILFLVVSGGHTQLVLMKDHLKYEIIGKTRDDAVGEAFDKGAKMLGLGYPGGPIIDQMAAQGEASFTHFPIAKLKNAPFDFSFSGLKTALLTYLNKTDEKTKKEHLADICASYQKAVVDALIEKTIRAIEVYKAKQIGLAGGVAANSLLRSRLADECRARSLNFYQPELAYCTDNAAMIARAGLEYLRRGHYSSMELNAFPALKLGSNGFYD
ncbi:MAG TPA: tRNA (adenosine(37)-N6)-threonylcarbamoyltransferase complex transferase subunit TsaD [Calditrichaeota bacterium]|nr:tRNA (adenosine(37)-N6)-threonylcarbamoyltransferase complex transferase subunit TsaD [Calditrichota bacterium]